MTHRTHHRSTSISRHTPHILPPKYIPSSPLPSWTTSCPWFWVIWRWNWFTAYFQALPPKWYVAHTCAYDAITPHTLTLIESQAKHFSNTTIFGFWWTGVGSEAVLVMWLLVRVGFQGMFSCVGPVSGGALYWTFSPFFLLTIYVGIAFGCIWMASAIGWGAWWR